MDILSKNLEELKELKKIYPVYKNKIYQTENTKINLPTVKINNIYLHSKYDPVIEAERISEILLKDKDELDVLLIFGGGLGYVPRLLFDKIIKNSNLKILPYIIYIEADIKLFFTSINCFDWSEILRNENFKIFLEADKEQIGAFIQSIPTKRIRYFYHRPSFMLNENYYKRIQKYIEYILDRKDMNNATFSRFQKVWTRNIIFNLPYYINSNYLNSLKDTAKGIPSILAAGGPSLEKSIDFIKNNQDNAVIISVDTAYKYLLKKGITPDILVTIDPQFWNYKYIENLKIDNTIIITDSSSYYKVLQLSDPDKYFIGSSIFPVISYFDPESSDRGTLAAGGSVATTAFDAARIIGSSEIILTGLDLSYPKRMTHFKGAFFETRFLKISDYFNTAEHMSYSYLTHVPLKKVRATDNQEVYSDQKMIMFKKWFEREIQLTNCIVYLPDFGGSYIEGTKILNINQINIKKISKKVFHDNIKSIKNNSKSLKSNEINKKINNFIKNTFKIKDLCANIIKLIPDSGVLSDNNMNEVNKLEKQLMDNPEYKEIADIISSSAQSVLLSIMENISLDNDQKKSGWKKTKLIYQSIYELTDFFTNSFKKMLKQKY